MTLNKQDDRGRAGVDDARSAVESRTALVWCDTDPFDLTQDVAQSIDETVRGLSVGGDLVNVALAPVSLPASSSERPAAAGVLVTAVIRPAS